MADISQELQAIMQAIFGEDVRGSIHDAIEKINDVSEVVVTVGTAVTGVDSSTEGYFEDSLYLNDNTWDLWKCTGTAWALEGNIKGAQGIPGEDGTSTSFTVGTKVGRDQPVTFTDGTHSETIHIMDGQDGTGSTLNSLTDVDISSPSNNQVLKYDSANNKWVNGSGGGGSGGDLGDLDDVDITTPTANQTLKYNSNDQEWENGDVNLSELGDVAVASLQGKQHLEYDNTLNKWTNKSGWVETNALTATANSTTSLVFNSTTCPNYYSLIHPDSFIRIIADASDTMDMPITPGVHNYVKPIFARIDYQDEGECQIIFDKQPVTTYFSLYINNDFS